MGDTRRTTIMHEDSGNRLDAEQTDEAAPSIAISKLDGSGRLAVNLSSDDVAALIGFLKGAHPAAA